MRKVRFCASIKHHAFLTTIWRVLVAVRKQSGHTFSLDHVFVASEEAAHLMRTYRRQYDVCVGRVSEARRAL